MDDIYYKSSYLCTKALIMKKTWQIREIRYLLSEDNLEEATKLLAALLADFGQLNELSNELAFLYRQLKIIDKEMQLGQIEVNQVLKSRSKISDRILEILEEYLQIGWQHKLMPNLENPLHSFASDGNLKLYFDLEEFSKDEVVEVISLLSTIYQSIGGDKLEIKKMDTLEFVGTPILA